MTRTFTYKLSLLIKIGKEEHIDRLRQKGLIHSKTVKYFREHEIEEIELRRDNREGAESSMAIKDLKLIVDNKELPFTFKEGRLNIFDPSFDLTHIYCLYAVTPDSANGQLFIDPRVANFGETALLITNPEEFIKRIEKATKNKYNCSYKPVMYYSDAKDYSRLSIFHKPESLGFQQEFRFHFNHIENDDLEFEIGSIEDISVKIESENLGQLTLRRE
ncbi:MAG: hypothetical protein DSY77_03045 [Bacteroidetes bacterium]|nr:MAG: hypothetical protein DSY77_03045 [Bacteroidota bacterium]